MIGAAWIFFFGHHRLDFLVPGALCKCVGGKPDSAVSESASTDIIRNVGIRLDGHLAIGILLMALKAAYNKDQAWSDIQKRR